MAPALMHHTGWQRAARPRGVAGRPRLERARIQPLLLALLLRHVPVPPLRGARGGAQSAPRRHGRPQAGRSPHTSEPRAGEHGRRRPVRAWRSRLADSSRGRRRPARRGTPSGPWQRGRLRCSVLLPRKGLRRFMRPGGFRAGQCRPRVTGGQQALVSAQAASTSSPDTNLARHTSNHSQRSERGSRLRPALWAAQAQGGAHAVAAQARRAASPAGAGTRRA